jgi:small conductance mechanosensitive channel
VALFDVNLWLTFGSRGLRLLAIILVAHLIIRLGNKNIDYLFQSRRGLLPRVETPRGRTLAIILKSVLRYGVDFFAAMSILPLFDIQPTSILAGAGIVGLAVGFGAQNLVRDIITGFFILYEDQFSVGEYIATAGVSGVVEELGLRMTKLRDFGGEVHIIPNGAIDKVTNFSRGKMQALVKIGVAYEEDVDRVRAVLEEVAQEAARDLADKIEEGPTVLGITDFGPSEVVFSVLAKTKPMEQWAVERELRRRIKLAFEREGIEIPYPKHVIFQGEGAKPANPSGSRER